MARCAAAFLAVLLAVFEVGSCMRCYQCQSVSDPTCKDPFTPGRQSVDCSLPASVAFNQNNLYNIFPAEMFGSVVGAPRYCHKIVLATGTVVRTCLDGDPNDLNHTCRSLESKSKFATEDRRIKYCSMCDKDNCNGAASLAFSLPLAAVTLVASYLLYKQ